MTLVFYFSLTNLNNFTVSRYALLHSHEWDNFIEAGFFVDKPIRLIIKEPNVPTGYSYDPGKEHYYILS